MAFYAPHALAHFQSVNFKRRDGLCSIFERFNHVTGLRIAKELGVLRQYVRGKQKVLRDIALSWELYEAMFPEPKPS